MEEVNKLDADKVRKFTQDKGQKLSREALSKKIFCAFNKKDNKDPVAKALNKVFQSVDFARADGENLASNRFVELMDKASFNRPSR